MYELLVAVGSTSSGLTLGLLLRLGAGLELAWWNAFTCGATLGSYPNLGPVARLLANALALAVSVSCVRGCLVFWD